MMSCWNWALTLLNLHIFTFHQSKNDKHFDEYYLSEIHAGLRGKPGNPPAASLGDQYARDGIKSA